MSTHRIADFTPADDGELTSVTVDDREIAIVVTDGQVYAFDDECTHQQCSLADGELEGRTVTCPCHFGVFDITTGAVVSGPPKEAVRTYPARLVDGTLELEVDE